MRSLGHCFFLIVASLLGLGLTQNALSQVSYNNPVIVYPANVHSSTGSTIALTQISSPVQDWETLVADAKNNLREASLPNPKMAKTKLQLAMDQVYQFVRPDLGTNGARWLEFLEWKKLQKELDSDEPDPAIFDQLERNMRQNYNGLELSPFSQLRSAIDEYSKAIILGDEPDFTMEEIETKLKKIVPVLGAQPEGADSKRRRNVANFFQLLIDAKQGKGLVDRIRAHFSKPNARVLVSREFIAKQLARPVAQPAPISDTILGTPITGNSFLSGSVNPQLVSNNQRATIRLALEAQFCSDSVGINRGVQILSKGSAPVRVTETLSLFDSGLQTLNDTAVSADLHTDIVGIQHRSRIVRRIASKKVAQQQPLANAIGQGKLVNRLGPQFHEQLQEQLAKTNERIKTPEPPAVRRLGLSMPTMTSWSSSDYLALLWKLQGEKQLAAVSSCPIPVEHTGVTLQLHQSAVLNLLDPVLRGRTIKNSELDDYALQVTKVVPKPILDASKEAPWTLTLDDDQPIEVQFDNELITFRIRTARLERGSEQPFSLVTTVEASYKVQLQSGAIQLIREGEVSINFAGEQRGAKYVAPRAFLKERFNGVFKKELLDKPIRPLDQLPAGAPPLSLASIHSDDGWLQVHLR